MPNDVDSGKNQEEMSGTNISSHLAKPKITISHNYLTITTNLPTTTIKRNGLN